MQNSSIETLDDLAIDSAIAKIADIIKKNRLAGREKDKYYIIRESVLTENLEYGFDKTTLTDLGIDFSLEELLKVNPKAKWDKNLEFQLGFTYPKPLRVFYKSEYLSILSSAGGGITVIRKNEDPFIQLAWDPKLNNPDKLPN